MKRILPLLFVILATGCARKITTTSTNTTERTTEKTTTDSTKVREAVEVSTNVKDSASAEINADTARKTIDQRKEFTTEARSGGVRTILRIDSTGRITCEARVDSLIRVIDSLEYWQKHTRTEVKTDKTTTTTTETIKETWQDRWAKRLVLPLVLICLILGVILGLKR